jgi:hypothetical protein
MIIERKENGVIVISAIINQQLIKQTYYFMSIKGAKMSFNTYIREIKKNWYEYLAK